MYAYLTRWPWWPQWTAPSTKRSPRREKRWPFAPICPPCSASSHAIMLASFQKITFAGLTLFKERQVIVLLQFFFKNIISISNYVRPDGQDDAHVSIWHSQRTMGKEREKKKSRRDIILEVFSYGFIRHDGTASHHRVSPDYPTLPVTFLEFFTLAFLEALCKQAIHTLLPRNHTGEPIRCIALEKTKVRDCASNYVQFGSSIGKPSIEDYITRIKCPPFSPFYRAIRPPLKTPIIKEGREEKKKHTLNSLLSLIRIWARVMSPSLGLPSRATFSSSVSTGRPDDVVCLSSACEFASEMKTTSRTTQVDQKVRDENFFVSLQCL